MAAAFLECELEEIAFVLARDGRLACNIWFDRTKIKWRIKKSALLQQELKCCYCQRFQATTNNSQWDLEHVLAEDIYPEFFMDAANICVACKACNIAKGSTDVLAPGEQRPPPSVPLTPNSYTIPHPHLTTWGDHLRHTMHVLYEGLTAQGEMLISVCGLNTVAEQWAGTAPGAIQTAINEKFFEVVRPELPERADDAGPLNMAAVEVAALIVQQVQLAPLLEKVRLELTTGEKKAIHRAARMAAKGGWR